MKKIKEKGRAGGVSRRLIFKGLFSAGWRVQTTLNISSSVASLKYMHFFCTLSCRKGGSHPS